MPKKPLPHLPAPVANKRDGIVVKSAILFADKKRNEKGKLYQAVLPNFTTDGKVWENYFEDIHAIDKEENNFVRKLSCVSSKELSFQQYKALNQGKYLKAESATYGNDICFPGDQLVAMANGRQKLLKEVKPGEQVLTIDPATKKSTMVLVKELVSYEAKNYAITRLLVTTASEKTSQLGKEVNLSSKVLEATPNHPIQTYNGNRKMGEINLGEDVLCYNSKTGKYEPFTVLNKAEYAGGVQKVYNIEAAAGATFMMNDVLVLQK